MRGTMLGRGWRVLVGTLLLAGCATAPPRPASELVWPLPPEPARIKHVEVYSRQTHFRAQGRDRLREIVLGEDPTAGIRMLKPLAVTSDARGRIYVTDTGLGHVWVFDEEKKEVRFLGDSGQGRLATPAGIAVDSRGLVYVSDTKLDRIFAFDQSGKVVLAIGQKDEFYAPSGLALHEPSGRLYVADAGRHKVRAYDKTTGAFLFEFGERGTEAGQFNYPTHIFVRKSRLYVADTMNFRIQVFDLDGRPVGKLGQMGANLGQFARPKGVAADSDGNVYVVDAAFNNFQIFNERGELLLFVGRVGTKPGEFWLPAGMHIDEQDRIYVVDQYNRRIQVFQYLSELYVAKAKREEATRK